MKQGQYLQEQIIAILHEADTHKWVPGEQTIQAICREHGLTETTFYRWRRAYSGMTVSEKPFEKCFSVVVHLAEAWS